MALLFPFSLLTLPRGLIHTVVLEGPQVATQ